MIKVNELRGIFAREGKTMKEVAHSLEITPNTMYKKMKKGVFDSDEIYKMIESLNIKNPTEIFFANNGT